MADHDPVAATPHDASSVDDNTLLSSPPPPQNRGQCLATSTAAPPPVLRRRPYWILSLDGGGVRYVMQLVLLRRLHEALPWLLGRVDLVAGTSAGAMTGTAVVHLGIESAYAFLAQPQVAERIFHASWARTVTSLHGLYAAEFDPNSVAAVIDEFLQPSDMTLTQLVEVAARHRPDRHRTDLLVTAFCVEPPVPLRTGSLSSSPPPPHAPSARTTTSTSTTFLLHPTSDGDDVTERRRQSHGLVPNVEWRRRIYRTFVADTGSRGGGGGSEEGAAQPTDVSVRDVLLQSSAAPTFFPIHQGCIDGGVMANNVTMIAAGLAVRSGKADSLDDLRVVSLGSGVHAENMYGHRNNLGTAQWLPHIVDVLFDASADGADEVASSLMGAHNCLRVQIALPRNVSLSDYRAVPKLMRWAESVDLTEVVKRLNAWKNVEDAATCAPSPSAATTTTTTTGTGAGTVVDYTQHSQWYADSAQDNHHEDSTQSMSEES